MQHISDFQIDPGQVTLSANQTDGRLKSANQMPSRKRQFENQWKWTYDMKGAETAVKSGANPNQFCESNNNRETKCFHTVWIIDRRLPYVAFVKPIMIF